MVSLITLCQPYDNPCVGKLSKGEVMYLYYFFTHTYKISGASLGQEGLDHVGQ